GALEVCGGVRSELIGVVPHGDLTVVLLDRFVQGAVSDIAPGARDIGPDVDVQRGCSTHIGCNRRPARDIPQRWNGVQNGGSPRSDDVVGGGSLTTSWVAWCRWWVRAV